MTKKLIVLILSIILVLVVLHIISKFDHDEKVPKINWIYRPTLIYEHQGYFLESNYRIEEESLDLSYIGVLNGNNTLQFNPKDNFEANTFMGYYLFINKKDNSNKYVYVSPSLTVVEYEDLIVFKK